ncbi:MAG: lipoate--protein ligase [Bacteroidales bacterium]|nr:lipoate--protein ligase [Bacteroidales bacterium]
MRVILPDTTDPFINLAAEEYLLKHSREDCFLLWRSTSSVVVGKHQNPMAETNHPLVSKRDIPVIRRISGGGTVYHDIGNVNFSFIITGEAGKLVDFEGHSRPVLEALNEMGIPARFEGKNDLRCHGLKISGNAEHVFRNRVLHHGTLLFDSDLTLLHAVLENDPAKYTGRAIPSVRSPVANISGFLARPPDIDTFIGSIRDVVMKRLSNPVAGTLTTEESGAISRLAERKYTTWEWNFGYGPPYRMNTTHRIEKWTVGISIEVEQGVIRKMQVTGDDLPPEIRSLDRLLTGIRHYYYDVKRALIQTGFASGPGGETLEGLVSALF